MNVFPLPLLVHLCVLFSLISVLPTGSGKAEYSILKKEGIDSGYGNCLGSGNEEVGERGCGSQSSDFKFSLLCPPATSHLLPLYLFL